MVTSHAVGLDRMPEWSAKTDLIAGGVRLTVIAKKPDDAKLVARIRGLGFAGLITEGAHHQPHYLAMARNANRSQALRRRRMRRSACEQQLACISPTTPANP